ncbi:MAG TPA: hypothetical protein PKE32_06630 [Miltoncostaeaceae bacterium]|nr:hypothetical protein [Miltoncostaeaceae bacterium]
MVDRSELVADRLWLRVRELADRVAELEAFERLGELDEDGQRRLLALRERCRRATGRAGLADDLSDRLAEVRRRSASGDV